MEKTNVYQLYCKFTHLENLKFEKNSNPQKISNEFKKAVNYHKHVRCSYLIIRSSLTNIIRALPAF